jgi:exosortase/archaeosortase family protein
MYCAGIYKANGLDKPRIFIARRDIFIWAMVVLFINNLFSILTEVRFEFFGELSAISIFQWMAWYAIFYLLSSSDTTSPARFRDIVVMAALCLLVLLPTSRMIWVAAAIIAIYLLTMHRGDPKVRAAGAVLGALAVQQFWGHVLFNLVAFPLLRAETAVVGTMLQTTLPGTVWQDNIITSPNGFGLVIHTACSSYHNLSLAMLCWITVSKLYDQNWKSFDLIMGSAVVGTMLVLNLVRLYLMAYDINRYYYWHEGAGASIFAIGASLTIFSMSLYGSRRRGC